MRDARASRSSRATAASRAGRRVKMNARGARARVARLKSISVTESEFEMANLTVKNCFKCLRNVFFFVDFVLVVIYDLYML